MLVLSEKKLRKVIREEFERLMEGPTQPNDDITIHAVTGADVIFPNYIKERFDSGKVSSFNDIL